MLKSLFSIDGESIIFHKGFEKGSEMLMRHIAAIRLWIKGKIGNGAVFIEIHIHPQFNAFQIKIQSRGEIFHVDQALAPGMVGLINIIVVNGEEKCGMRLGQFEIMLLMLSDQVHFRERCRLDKRLRMSADHYKGECYA